LVADERTKGTAMNLDWRSVERPRTVALETAKRALLEELVVRGVEPQLAEGAIGDLVDAVRAYERTAEVVR
jgi:hypothetical protein